MNILFVCSQNAGLSQLAAALLKRRGGHEVRSRGTALTERIQPVVVETLLEIDFDLSRRHPQLLIAEDSEWADVIVTMGCQDSCPIVPGKYYLEWDLPDPAGMDLDQARELREQIETRVEELAEELPEDVRSFKLADSKHTFHLAVEPASQDGEVRSFKLADPKHSFRER